MKKFLSIVVALCMLLSMAGVAGAADYSLAIKDNVAVMAGSTVAIAGNSLVTLPVAPVIENDRMLVPVRFAAEAFGADVAWDAGKRLVTLTFGNERVVEMVIGNKNISVNGQIYETDAAPIIRDGYTMLPVAFLAETVLGKKVLYDDASKMAVISTRRTISTRDTDVIAQISGAITSGILPPIVVTAPIESGSAVIGGGSGAETGKLTIATATADQEPEPDNGVYQMIDGSTSTRWASQGAASATLDLGSEKPVTHLRVAVWKPNERSTNYSLEVSSNGSRWTSIFDGASSGATYDKYDVNDKIRYVKINTNGTSQGAWASILELEVWNGTAQPTGGAGGTITPVSVSADQTPEPENVAENVFDGSTDTKWACQGTGTLTVDLGSAQQVSSIELNFWKYAERTTNYQLQVSADGSSYQSVFSGSSQLGAEYDVRNVNQSVRYIKFIGTGTSQGDWTSLNEMVIKSGGAGGGTGSNVPTTTAGGTEISAPTGTKVSISAANVTVTAEPEADNNKNNLVDGDKMTVWASQNENNAVFDLGSAKTLSCVGVAMKMYEDDRTIPYDISVSSDGVSYTQIWSGNSEPQTNSFKYVSASSSARYVKVTAYGNTVSGWNSIAEVEIYTK